MTKSTQPTADNQSELPYQMEFMYITPSPDGKSNFYKVTGDLWRLPDGSHGWMIPESQTGGIDLVASDSDTKKDPSNPPEASQ